MDLTERVDALARLERENARLIESGNDRFIRLAERLDRLETTVLLIHDRLDAVTKHVEEH